MYLKSHNNCILCSFSKSTWNWYSNANLWVARLGATPTPAKSPVHSSKVLYFENSKCKTWKTKKQNFSIILSFNLQLSFFQLSDPPLYRSVLLLTHKAPTDLKWQLDLILLKYCTCKWRSTFLPAFPPDNPTEGAASNLCRNSVLMLGPLTQCSWRLKCKLTRVACTVVTQTTLKKKPYTSHCWHTVFKIENLIKSHFGQSISTANKDSVTGQKQSF